MRARRGASSRNLASDFFAVSVLFKGWAPRCSLLVLWWSVRCDQESLDVIDAEIIHDNNPIRLTNFSSRRDDDDDDLPEINGR